MEDLLFVESDLSAGEVDLGQFALLDITAESRTANFEDLQCPFGIDELAPGSGAFRGPHDVLPVFRRDGWISTKNTA